MTEAQFEFIEEHLPEECTMYLSHLARVRYEALAAGEDERWCDANARMQGVLLGLSYAGFADYRTLLSFGTRLFSKAVAEEVMKELKREEKKND